MKELYCKYQDNGMCASYRGKFCKGHPELKECNFFIAYDCGQEKVGRRYHRIWAFDKKRAEHKLNVGIMGRENSPFLYPVVITQIPLDEDLSKSLAQRFGLELKVKD